jgi:hypothetical protein
MKHDWIAYWAAGILTVAFIFSVLFLGFEVFVQSIPNYAQYDYRPELKDSCSQK